MEGYIQKHIVDVDFTHRLCPEYLINFSGNRSKLIKHFIRAWTSQLKYRGSHL